MTSGEDRANGTLWRNNWGASTVRSFLAQYYLDTLTEAQRSYMAVSEITTPDNRLADVDRKMVYYDLDGCYVTQDFLYLPAVEDASTHRVVVGERLSDEPKDYSTGLLVSASYLSGISVPNSWTRTPTYLRDSQDSGDDNSSFNTYAMSIKNDGYTRNEVSLCDKPFDEQVHDYVLEDAKEPTCTEEGYTGDQVCSACDWVIRGTTIPATDHSFTTYVPNNDATCTEDGTETATCDNGCGETDTRTVAGSAKGHTFENGVCTACGAEDPDYAPPEQVPADEGSADEDSADENPADKGDAIPATGDASLLLAAASILLGGSTVAVGMFMRRKR